MNYYGIDNDQYELKHYGVKGMKWKNHKYKTYDYGLAGRKNQKYNKEDSRFEKDDYTTKKNKALDKMYKESKNYKNPILAVKDSFEDTIQYIRNRINYEKRDRLPSTSTSGKIILAGQRFIENILKRYKKK